MSTDFDQSELALFRENVRRFITNEIAPNYELWERDGIFPRELWQQLGEAGLLCVDIPETYGGFGAPFRCSMIIQEEFSRAGYVGVGGSMAVHSDIVAHYLLNFGSEAQKEFYLPKMVSGELVGAIGMTEPSAGSDLQGIRTSAKADGDDFVISGSKTFITNGQHCDFVVTVAKTDPNVPGSRGTSLFIVDTYLDGFERGRNLEKIGMHSADTSELFFDNVQVQKSALLGELHGGFKVLMKELQRERLALAISGVAAAQGALEQTVEYVKERTAFGKPIAALQNTRFRLAQMQTDFRVNQAFIEQCIQAYERKELDVTSASMAKYSATEMQGRVVDGCLQLFGGYGYMVEYPIARFYVDARVQRIYGGTSEIMLELISRDVLG